MHEELSQKAQKKVNELGNEILIQLKEDVQPYLESYTEYNMIMNVISGCVVKIMQKIPDEHREQFIRLVAENLVENLNHFRKLGI